MTYIPGGGGGGGTTTNSLTITNTGGAAPGVTFNGSAARTIDYSTVGASASGHNHNSSYLQISNNLSDLANAGTARTNLGLAIGTNVQAYNANLTTYAGIAPSANVQSLLGAANYAAIRTQLTLTVGTDVQAWDADLDAIAALSGTDTIYRRSGAATWSAVTFNGNMTFSGGAISVTGWRPLGGSYASVGVWDQAVDGSSATITFTGLSGATDIQVIQEAVTKANSGVSVIHVSVDNGSNWFTTSGDYAFTDTAGVRTNATTLAQLHLTNATAARDGIVEIHNANKGRPVGFLLTCAVSHRLFLGSTSPINAIRITNSAGGNFTGGKFYCLVR